MPRIIGTIDFAAAKSVAKSVATHTLAVLHAVESDDNGRLRREWRVLPVAGDMPNVWSAVPCQYKIRGLTASLNEGRTVDREFDAVVVIYDDVPVVPQHRILVDSTEWKIIEIAPDLIGTLIYLERTSA